MALPSSYSPNVPVGIQQINNTQSPININFQDIYDAMGVNHIAFNIEDYGKHFQVNYYNQNSDPTSPVSASVSMYSKQVNDDTNVLELFYQYPNGTVAQLPTSNTSSSSSTSTNGNGGIEYSSYPFPGYVGYQYLSGGLLMKFGIGYSQEPITNTSGIVETLTANFPTSVTLPIFTQTPYIMQAGIDFANTGSSQLNLSYPTIHSIGAVSATQYKWYQGGPYAVGYFYWLAIGI